MSVFIAIIVGQGVLTVYVFIKPCLKKKNPFPCEHFVYEYIEPFSILDSKHFVKLVLVRELRI